MSVDVSKVGTIEAHVCHNGRQINSWGFSVRIRPCVPNTDPEHPALREVDIFGTASSKEEAEKFAVAKAAENGAPFSIWSFVDEEGFRGSDAHFNGTIFIANR